MKFLRNVQGCNAFAYEYTGYGFQFIEKYWNAKFYSSKADGMFEQHEPSEEDVYADSEAAIQYVIKKLKVPTMRIILYGRSLGSGPTIYLASKYEVAGVILHSPISSIYRVLFDFRWTFPGDMFPNYDRIREVRCPVMVIHGMRDEVVPLRHAEQLHENCQHKVDPLYFENAGHNNFD